jgi:predicted dithiol-disulfide oxidoreductase (DUF899 family)
MDLSHLSELEKQIGAAENELTAAKTRLVELRKQLPRDEITNYALTTPDEKSVQLADLFGDKNDMILIHNMGKGCRYCTLWADGFNSILDHLQDRAAFIVTTPNKPRVVKEFSESRNWQFPIFSAHGTSLLRDLGFESDKGDPWPGVSTLHKDENGKITRVAKAFFGPGDDFCSVWHFFDMLADGTNKWEPQYRYDK